MGNAPLLLECERCGRVLEYTKKGDDLILVSPCRYCLLEEGLAGRDLGFDDGWYAAQRCRIEGGTRSAEGGRR